jgi:four helix bundle protein
MANRIEELPVFQHAQRFCDAVIAILERPAVRSDHTLWEQINEANDSITSNMKEGFEQGSDDGFAKFLVYAKGSCAEVLIRLQQACGKRYITTSELEGFVDPGEELQRMLGGFIKYLHQSGFRDRGSFRARQARKRRPNQ